MRAPQIIWVVDDDPSVRSGLSDLLSSYDYDVEIFESGASLLEHASEAQPDCIISDVQMPGMSGVEMFLRLLSAGKYVPTIFITAYPTPELQRQAFASGACAFLNKPFMARELTAAISTAVRNVRG
ncbi:response regulator transcription factor [Paraburkholderia pallida]|uniref:Response regulator n=1 Tax=Paraburkholderia pallida TaxID=2547399 RepID=A0A4P7D4F8_9BURK|nr:response regulator [Paraburkholderia pallida]QBR03636.1 response regulator [Paraburkholderia pallida]